MKQNNKNVFQKTMTVCRYGLLYAEETCKSSFRTDFSRPLKNHITNMAYWHFLTNC